MERILILIGIDVILNNRFYSGMGEKKKTLKKCDEQLYCKKCSRKCTRKKRIMVIADEREVSRETQTLLERQAEIYQAKGIQDAFFHLTVFSYHLILIALKREQEVNRQIVESIRKLVVTPILILLPENSNFRSQIIHEGADVALKEPYTPEEVSLQVYALLRRHTEWKMEKAEEVLIVGALEINVLQRTVSWNQREIQTAKREFDFLYLLASTPGRVYTYSQIYHMVWQEYPHGDITNIIYCMIHRLKQKLKQIDISAGNIICSVKEVGYCLKIHKE